MYRLPHLSDYILADVPLYVCIQTSKLSHSGFQTQTQPRICKREVRARVEPKAFPFRRNGSVLPRVGIRYLKRVFFRPSFQTLIPSPRPDDLLAWGLLCRWIPAPAKSRRDLRPAARDSRLRRARSTRRRRESPRELPHNGMLLLITLPFSEVPWAAGEGQ